MYIDWIAEVGKTIERNLEANPHFYDPSPPMAIAPNSGTIPLPTPRVSDLREMQQIQTREQYYYRAVYPGEDGPGSSGVHSAKTGETMTNNRELQHVLYRK